MSTALFQKPFGSPFILSLLRFAPSRISPKTGTDGCAKDARSIIKSSGGFWSGASGMLMPGVFTNSALNSGIFAATSDTRSAIDGAVTNGRSASQMRRLVGMVGGAGGVFSSDIVGAGVGELGEVRRKAWASMVRLFRRGNGASEEGGAGEIGISTFSRLISARELWEMGGAGEIGVSTFSRLTSARESWEMLKSLLISWRPPRLKLVWGLVSDEILVSRGCLCSEGIGVEGREIRVRSCE